MTRDLPLSAAATISKWIAHIVTEETKIQLIWMTCFIKRDLLQFLFYQYFLPLVRSDSTASEPIPDKSLASCHTRPQHLLSHNWTEKQKKTRLITFAKFIARETITKKSCTYHALQEHVLLFLCPWTFVWSSSFGTSSTYKQYIFLHVQVPGGLSSIHVLSEYKVKERL